MSQFDGVAHQWRYELDLIGVVGGSGFVVVGVMGEFEDCLSFVSLTT